MLDTINVIEINGDDGLISSCRSFPSTDEGVEQAEQLFLQLIRETTDVDVDALSFTLIDNGFCDVPGGGTIQLVNSTNN